MRLSSLVGVVVAALLLVPQAAQAEMIALQVSDGVNPTITITDGGVGDSNPGSGVITWIGSIGDWSGNVTTGKGSDVLGTGNIDLNSSDDTGTSTTTTTLSILFTQYDNSTAFPTFEMAFGGTIQGGSVIYNAYYDGSNSPFGMAVSIGSIGPFAGGASDFAFSGSTSGSAGTTTPYALTQEILITGDGTHATAFSGNASLSGAVPEPASLFLLGGGLLALGLRIRRRSVG